jgi:hypothetical protein
LLIIASSSGSPGLPEPVDSSAHPALGERRALRLGRTAVAIAVTVVALRGTIVSDAHRFFGRQRWQFLHRNRLRLRLLYVREVGTASRIGALRRLRNDDLLLARLLDFVFVARRCVLDDDEGHQNQQSDDAGKKHQRFAIHALRVHRLQLRCACVEVRLLRPLLCGVIGITLRVGIVALGVVAGRSRRIRR